jgi:hypothetical protein
MIIIYRYSEKDSPGKEKMATKLECFANFVRTLGADTTNKTILVVDNAINAFALKDLKAIWEEQGADLHNLTIEKRDCSTASMSQLATFDIILSGLTNYRGYETVYILEDDYLHLEDATKFLNEGLSICDYVSLYDHPDKYEYPGPNPELVSTRSGAAGENTIVYLTPSSHWKLTNSTTMTFAAKLGTLRSDIMVMKKFCQGEYPNDYEMFAELRKFGKTLTTAIPGRATHAEKRWLTPLVDWDTPKQTTKELK